MTVELIKEAKFFKKLILLKKIEGTERELYILENCGDALKAVILNDEGKIIDLDELICNLVKKKEEEKRTLEVRELKGKIEELEIRNSEHIRRME